MLFEPNQAGSEVPWTDQTTYRGQSIKLSIKYMGEKCMIWSITILIQETHFDPDSHIYRTTDPEFSFNWFWCLISWIKQNIFNTGFLVVTFGHQKKQPSNIGVSCKWTWNIKLHFYNSWLTQIRTSHHIIALFKQSGFQLANIIC